MKFLTTIIWILALSNIVVGAPLVYMEPPTTTVQPNREFQLDVKVDTLDEIYSIQFDLVYNENILELTSLTEGNFLNRFAETEVKTYKEQGKITFVIKRLRTRSGINGIGTIAEVRFRALQNGGNTEIKLASVQITDAAFHLIDGVLTEQGEIHIEKQSPPPMNLEPGAPSELEQQQESVVNEELEAQGSLPEQQLPEEHRSFAQSIFILLLLVVLALGALSYMYINRKELF